MQDKFVWLSIWNQGIKKQAKDVQSVNTDNNHSISCVLKYTHKKLNDAVSERNVDNKIVEDDVYQKYGIIFAKVILETKRKCMKYVNV